MAETHVTYPTATSSKARKKFKKELERSMEPVARPPRISRLAFGIRWELMKGNAHGK